MRSGKRSKRGWALFLGLGLLFALQACGFGDKAPEGTGEKPAPDVEALTVKLEAPTDVVETGAATPFRVRVEDERGQPVDVEKVYLFTNMEGMHHPTEGTMRHVGPGTYELRLPLAMAGEWYAEVTVTAGGKTKTFTGYTVRAEGKTVHAFMKGYNADEQGELPEGWKPGAADGPGDRDHASGSGVMGHESDESGASQGGAATEAGSGHGEGGGKP
ncbi:MAG: FixH family protein [Hydrogenibacillus schlegelii]|uniref:FixH family protein n=1 Tax=Hydrogenibacillus schlegelii TaxID=1484 RepID=A0A947D0R6_HYDSH|nr:FixH family protein [Hydrogenibacillus schlegelii]